MSTRCTINFGYGGPEDGTLIAKIYRHSDGYPEEPGVLSDLRSFFEAVITETRDHRFDDPSYLSTKFVVWQARQLAQYQTYTATEDTPETGSLNFLGVGIESVDPGDLSYTYWVACGRGRTPEVYWRPIREEEWRQGEPETEES
jgi:hypothetical protein